MHHSQITGPARIASFLQTITSTTASADYLLTAYVSVARPDASNTANNPEAIFALPRFGTPYILRQSIQQPRGQGANASNLAGAEGMVAVAPWRAVYFSTTRGWRKAVGTVPSANNWATQPANGLNVPLPIYTKPAICYSPDSPNFKSKYLGTGCAYMTAFATRPALPSSTTTSTADDGHATTTTTATATKTATTTAGSSTQPATTTATTAARTLTTAAKTTATTAAATTATTAPATSTSPSTTIVTTAATTTLTASSAATTAQTQRHSAPHGPPLAALVGGGVGAVAVLAIVTAVVVHRKCRHGRATVTTPAT